MVQAFDLYLVISSHAELEWMNLAQLLPRLQVIHVFNFRCHNCDVSYLHTYNDDVMKYTEHTQPDFATTNKCFYATLGRLHPNVSYDRIFLGYRKPHPTLEQHLVLN